MGFSTPTVLNMTTDMYLTIKFHHEPGVAPFGLTLGYIPAPFQGAEIRNMLDAP